MPHRKHVTFVRQSSIAQSRLFLALFDPSAWKVRGGCSGSFVEFAGCRGFPHSGMMGGARSGALLSMACS